MTRARPHLCNLIVRSKLLSAAALFFLPSLSYAQTQKNSCAALPLTETKDSAVTTNEFKDLYSELDDLEKAFTQNSSAPFRSIVHPALHKTDSEKKALFDDLVLDLGLKDISIARTAIYELQFKTDGPPTADCNGDRIRGVVGPTHQVAVVLTVTGKEEQFRIFTLFAPIPPSLVAQKKLKRTLGLVHLQSQMWTYEHKSPEALLAEATKLSSEQHTFTAWFLAEAAKRLLASNPYIEYKLSKDAELQSQRYLPQPATLTKAQTALEKEKVTWKIEGYTTTFSSKGLGVGLKFRTPKDSSLEEMTKVCKAAVLAVASSTLQEVKARLSGVECLPYKEGEDISDPPSFGSQFFTWKNLGL